MLTGTKIYREVMKRIGEPRFSGTVGALCPAFSGLHLAQLAGDRTEEAANDIREGIRQTFGRNADVPKIETELRAILSDIGVPVSEAADYVAGM